MKFFAFFLAIFFLTTSPLQAVSIQEYYSSIEEEVEFYYQATGEWELIKILSVDFVPDDTQEFTIVSAKTMVRSIHSEKVNLETCLLTYISESRGFYSINCF